MAGGLMKVGSNCDGWVWMGGFVVDGLGCGWVRLWVPMDGLTVGGLACGSDGWIGGGWVDSAATVGGWVGCCCLGFFFFCLFLFLIKDWEIF